MYVDDEKWSNCQGKILLTALDSKVYYDLNKDSWNIKPETMGYKYIGYVKDAVEMLKEQAEAKAVEELNQVEEVEQVEEIGA